MSNAGARMPVAASLGRWARVGATMPRLTWAAMLAAASAERGRRALDQWAQRATAALGIDVEIEDRNQGRYDEPPYVFAQLNQSSLLEIVYWFQAVPRPTFSLVNIGWALLPPIGWVHLAAGAIPMVRQWPWQTRAALMRAEAKLRRGHNLALSLEGKRTTDGARSEFRKGGVVLAIKSGAKIVPLAFHGARERLPAGEWRVRPGRVLITLCEAIPTAGLGYDERDGLLAKLARVAEAELGPG